MSPADGLGSSGFDRSPVDQQLAAAGDVAHPDAWRDDRLVLNLAECPASGA